MRCQINDHWIFDEEACELVEAKGRAVLPMGSVQSRCLASLCLAKLDGDGLRTKKELFHAGWEKHGLSSSSNSLAQTIFQLRKLLQQLGVEKGITTIPRVGFKLSHIKVELAEDVPVYIPEKSALVQNPLYRYAQKLKEQWLGAGRFKNAFSIATLQGLLLLNVLVVISIHFWFPKSPTVIYVWPNEKQEATLAPPDLVNSKNDSSESDALAS